MTVIENPLLLRKKAAAAADDGEYTISKSLRFENGDTSYLTRDPSSNGNGFNWTVSVWFKRLNPKDGCGHSDGKQGQLFGSYEDGNNYTTINIDPAGKLEFDVMVGGSEYRIRGDTSGYFHDPSAWYNLVCICESQHATDSKRLRAYINGKKFTETSSTWPTQDFGGTMTTMGKTEPHYVGVQDPTTQSRRISALIADVQFMDGGIFEANCFGKFDKTGVWKPIAFKNWSPNDGRTHSAECSGTVGYGSFANAFDGDDSTLVHSPYPGTLCWKPVGGMSGDLRIYIATGLHDQAVDDEFDVRINNESVFDNSTFPRNTSGWVDLGFQEIKTFTWGNKTGGNWTAIKKFEINGIVLKDDTTDHTAVTNLNNNVDFGAQISISGSWDGSHNADNIFDGKASTRGEPADGALVTWTPASAVTGRLRVLLAAGNYSGGADGNFDVKVNDVSYWDHIGGVPKNTTAWRDFGTVTDMTTFKFGRDASGGSNGKFIQVKQVMIDGYVLKDNAVDNSCHLKFDDASSDANLGKDTLDNGIWTVNNLKASDSSNPENCDSFKDTPSNNYCTLSPYKCDEGRSDLKQGNLEWTSSGGDNWQCSTMGVKSGSGSTNKRYWEVEIKTASPGPAIGIATDDNKDYAHNNWGGGTTNNRMYLSHNGKLANPAGGSDLTYGSNTTSGAGDVIGVALDLSPGGSSGTITFYKDGSSLGQAHNDIDTTKRWFPIVADVGGGGEAALANFGQLAFQQTVPANHKELCTNNLSDTFSGDDVNNPSAYFDVAIWEGDDQDNRSIQGIGFKPELIIWNNRDNTEEWPIADAIRGVNNHWWIGSTDEPDDATERLTDFLDTGFKMGSDADGKINDDGDSFVAWMWDATGGSNSGTTPKSGASGQTHTATNSYWNRDAGFEILKYTGTGTAGKVGHNLGAKPDFMIFKALGASNINAPYWHNDFDSAGDEYAVINHEFAVATDAGAIWNDVEPTSDTFGVGTHNMIGSSSYTPYIAYLWTNIEGYSQAGAYTGWNSSTGPFIYTGFRPRFIWLKERGGSSASVLFDTRRDNQGNEPQGNWTFHPNWTNNDSRSAGTDYIDYYSNGFRITRAHGYVNNAAKYLYFALAEHPFKTANAV